jgi:hypothetical protein
MGARMSGWLGRGLVLALVVPGAAAQAAIKQQVLDYPSGSALHVTSITGGKAVDYTRAGDGAWVGMEVVPTSAGVQVLGVSHSALGLGVHAISDGTSNTIMFGEFVAGAGTVANPPFVLRDPRTNETTSPAAVRTITLDPGHPDSVLIDASHVYLPRTGVFRGLALVRRATGELVLADYELASTPVRRTSLGFTPPIGSNKGSFTVAPDGHVWAALASANAIRLLDLGDLSATGPLAPVQASSITMGAGFDPESTRVGIIAVLIGLLTQPKPAVSYQVGDTLFSHVLNGGDLTLLDRQDIPAGSLGLLEDEGIFFFLTPNGELYRGLTGSGLVAVPFGTIAY